MARTWFRRPRWRNDDWAYCRGVTNRILDIVVDIRHPHWGAKRKRSYRLWIVVSRKRWATFGNPGSDHHKSQKDADAIDFRFFREHVRYRMMKLVMERLGVSGAQDYGNYTITHNGRQFRIQPIAAVHGTGPHLHMGVRRIWT